MESYYFNIIISHFPSVITFTREPLPALVLPHRYSLIFCQRGSEREKEGLSEKKRVECSFFSFSSLFSNNNSHLSALLIRRDLLANISKKSQEGRRRKLFSIFLVFHIFSQVFFCTSSVVNTKA